ncbi:MAG: hypothetical protein ACI8ZB_004593 [Desulforhopalus sp.]|jgi:hypothetical protein
MNIAKTTSFFLLFILSTSLLVLSQLDNDLTGKVYNTVSKTLYIDLKSLHVTTGMISDGGHIVAGFVLSGLMQLSIRRWWGLPITLLFFIGIEVAQIPSTQREASWLDLLRGWSGALAAWFLVQTWALTRKK